VSHNISPPQKEEGNLRYETRKNPEHVVESEQRDERRNKQTDSKTRVQDTEGEKQGTGERVFTTEEREG